MVAQTKTEKASNQSGKSVGSNSSRKQTMKNNSAQSNNNVTLEPKGNNNETESDSDHLDLLEDICEVVISLKCKQCGFLCNDNSTLSRHINQSHPKHKKKNEAKRVKDDPQKNKLPDDIQKSPGKNSIQGESEQQVKSVTHTQPQSPSLQNSDGNETPNNLNTTDLKKTKVPGNDSMNADGNSKDDPYLMFCTECGTVFYSSEECVSHMNNVHGLYEFTLEEFFQEENSNPENDPDANLPSDKRKTKLPQKYPSPVGEVRKRFRKKKSEKHGCSRCSIKFENVDVMKFHEKCHSIMSKDKKKSCKTKTYHKKAYQVTKDSGELQIQEYYLPKGFFCPVCESSRSYSDAFTKWATCAWHLWKDHRIDCELYTCSICKQFKSYYLARVKDHELLHSEKASYKCKICTKSFKQLKQLRSHEKYHKDHKTKLAPEVDSRWYTPKECPICGRILSDSKCLKKHISAVHNKLKPFVCNICGHTSARKAELQLHVRQHTGEKPYKCTICKFQTGDHNSLRKHKLRHGDKRPYACPYCKYRCIQTCAFKKHLLSVHPEQDVVFLCQFCSHASVNEALFEAHQKEHSEKLENAVTSNGDSQSTKVSATATSQTDSDVEDGFTGNISGDDESLDIVDNGGVTIPASPVTSEPVPGRDTACASVTGAPSSMEELTPIVNNTSSLLSSAPEILFEKPNISGGSFTLLNSFVVVKGTNNSGESVLLLEPCNTKTTSNLTENVSTIVSSEPEHVLPVPVQPSVTPVPMDAQQQQAFSETNSIIHASPKSMSRPVEETFTGSSDYLRGPGQDIRGVDTESSSEVIFNPHQLIQNVQLTPLDLGVFEQSNDEGMLQRLLDMSGV